VRSLAADDLVKKYREFGGGVGFEADPRRFPEAHSRMQSAVRTKAPTRLPETATSFHSSEEPTACFTFGHVFPYGPTEPRIPPSVVFVRIGGVRPVLSEESHAVHPFIPS